MSKSGPKPNLPAPTANQCACSETILWNEEAQRYQRVDKPKWHSCRYIRMVNQYTAEAAAEAHAASVANYPDDSEYRRIKYMSEFARLMGQAREKVLAYLETGERVKRRQPKEQPNGNNQNDH